MVILVAGKCASCGHYWELNDGQAHPPAHAYITVNDDGTHTVKILCVNAQSCGGRH